MLAITDDSVGHTRPVEVRHTGGGVKGELDGLVGHALTTDASNDSVNSSFAMTEKSIECGA